MEYFPSTESRAPQGASRAIPLKTSGYRMISGMDERINGSIPVYGYSRSSASFEAEIAQSIADTISQKLEDNAKPSASHVMAFQGSDIPAETADANEGTSSFGFLDFLDIINPLQHIPIVNLVYRHITGDKIGAVAQVAGGALFGGPIGAAAGVANAVVQHETGKDVGESILGLFDGTTIASVDLTQDFTRTRSSYND